MNYKIIAQNTYDLLDLKKDIQNNPNQAPVFAIKAINADPKQLKYIIGQTIKHLPYNESYVLDVVREIIKAFPDKLSDIVYSSVFVCKNDYPTLYVLIVDEAIKIVGIDRFPEILDSANNALNPFTTNRPR